MAVPAPKYSRPKCRKREPTAGISDSAAGGSIMTFGANVKRRVQSSSDHAISNVRFQKSRRVRDHGVDQLAASQAAALADQNRLRR
jgi:hypothetical protein